MSRRVLMFGGLASLLLLAGVALLVARRLQTPPSRPLAVPTSPPLRKRPPPPKLPTVEVERGVFSEETRLEPDDDSGNSWFGSDIAMSGERLLVSFHGDDARGENLGSARLYERRGGGWEEIATLVAEDITNFSRYALHVALDGGVAMVTAEWEHVESYDRPGAVYVFEESEHGEWRQVAKLKPKDNHANQLFGSDVSLSGSRAVIGAAQDRDAGADAGAAYIFERKEDGQWSEVAKLKGGDSSKGDQFGAAVAISGDTAVVGSRHNDMNTGSAYVFQPDSSGAWRQTAKLKPADQASFDQFAISVATSGDRILVGKWRDSELVLRSGAAYVFERRDGEWVQTAKLKASKPGKHEAFGYSVLLHGELAVVGGIWFNVGRGSGGAHIFRPDADGVWRQIGKLIPDQPNTAGSFGCALALNDRVAAVAAEGAGAVYFFDLDAVREETRKLNSDR